MSISSSCPLTKLNGGLSRLQLGAEDVPSRQTSQLFLLQEAQLQRDRAVLHVIEYFSKSLIRYTAAYFDDTMYLVPFLRMA